MKLYCKIVLRGLPEAIAQFSTPVTTFCMNRTLMAAYGEIGINVFSIISYLSSFTMSVFFGASEGMQPLFGQAYGAKQEEDLKHYYRAGQLISIIGSAVCVVVYILFSHPLCRLFGGDWFAVSIVFTATLLGFFLRQRMQARGFNHYVIFIASSFAASMYASVALMFDTTSEVALATSVLFLSPGVPLINGVIDIVEGHVLNGIARLASALMLIICIAIGLSCTLMIVKNGLL